MSIFIRWRKTPFYDTGMSINRPCVGDPFRFCDAYCPPTPKNQRYAEARVWSLFRRAAPTLNLSPDFHRAVEGAAPYPLWIKPDAKLSLSDVFDLMRDHYEGTDYDMMKGIDAGPYGAPNRWRPMTWTVDGAEYTWERPVSTQQTGFSFVSQSRGRLPDPVGGVLWYGVDDTYTSCYVPIYCCADEVPPSFAAGSLDSFSWDSHQAESHEKLSRLPPVFRGGKPGQLLVGLGLVGVQLRGQLREPEVFGHGGGYPGLAEGARGNLSRPPAGGGENRHQARPIGPASHEALPDRLLGDPRRADGEALAGAGRASHSEVQRRLRPGRDRHAAEEGVSRGLAPEGRGVGPRAVPAEGERSRRARIEAGGLISFTRTLRLYFIGAAVICGTARFDPRSTL